MTTASTPKKKAPAKPKVAPPPEPLRVFQIGNFDPPHSTENHLLRALEENGCDVWTFQENQRDAFRAVTMQLAEHRPDFVLWTRTGWDWTKIYERGKNEANAEQRRMLRLCALAGVPVVGYHLDIWWGLARESEVTTEPFFEVNLLVTADGGHDDKWEAEGINHAWLPPGVSRGECEVGTRREEFVSRIAFVGSWDGGYHHEHRHRHELVDFLRRNYRRDCAFWPQRGMPAVRGGDLQDLYASVDVLVGDSCFAGQGLANYWSDRIPETLGRAGFLLHPEVEGLDAHFDPGVDLWTWKAGNFHELGDRIADALAMPEERREVAIAGRDHVLRDHTYERRIEQVIEMLRKREMIAP